MGYDIERFVDTVNEGLLCCICRDVLEEPLQSPCEHAFCATCIHAWLVAECTCPDDRRPLTTSQLRWALLRNIIYVTATSDRSIYCKLDQMQCWIGLLYIAYHIICEHTFSTCVVFEITHYVKLVSLYYTKGKGRSQPKVCWVQPLVILNVSYLWKDTLR